jgi:hypothetical protein
VQSGSFSIVRRICRAITLAGAAEEILGQAVGDQAAFAQLKTAFAGRLDISEKIISQQHLNKARNWLTHCDQRMDDEKICLELDEEAIQYIVWALTMGRSDRSRRTREDLR